MLELATLIAVITIAGVLVVGDVVGAVSRRRDSAASPSGWLEERLTDELIVHTTEGHSIRGLLTIEAADGVALTAVKLIAEGGNPVDLAGDVFVPRAQIAFVQRVT